jgi:hypothetical protein
MNCWGQMHDMLRNYMHVDAIVIDFLSLIRRYSPEELQQLCAYFTVIYHYFKASMGNHMHADAILIRNSSV